MTGPGGPAAPAWSAGAATGVGSLPFDDPHEAARVVAGELPDLPHVPELPGRGAGADLVGRTAVLLDGLGVDLSPAGWRLLGPRGRSGVDARRAVAALSRDLDAVEEALPRHDGPVKAQLCGPWTLAASLELPGGGPALSDAGAVRDVAGALGEAAREHVAAVRRRLPDACAVLLQLDEPSLPRVLAGRVPTASGLSAVRPVDAARARDLLADVLDAVVAAGAVPVVHCCDADVPVRLLVAAGARALSLDATLLHPRTDDDLGEALEAGVGLLAGLVDPRAEPRRRPPSADAGPVRDLWHRLGLDPATTAERVVVTPTCGLAGTAPADVVGVLSRAREVARVLAEAPDAEPDRAAGRGG